VQSSNFNIKKILEYGVMLATIYGAFQLSINSFESSIKDFVREENAVILEKISGVASEIKEAKNTSEKLEMRIDLINAAASKNDANIYVLRSYLQVRDRTNIELTPIIYNYRHEQSTK
jgi:hypothetical protein